VPFAKVGVDVGEKSKFGELVIDAGISTLQVLLLGHVMEKKHGDLEMKYKDVS